MFTSTESIMRNNPTNPSSIDHFEKLSRVEKQTIPEAGPSSRFSDMSMAGNLKPPRRVTAASEVKALPDSPVLPPAVARAMDRARQSSVAYVIPTLDLSTTASRSAGLDEHRSAFPRTPVPARMANAI